MSSQAWNPAALIGKPWKPRAAGPDGFDCWGLVRYVFANRYALRMPEVDVYAPGDDQARHIAEVYKASGWRPIGQAAPIDGDIVLLWSLAGLRHVGTMLHADRELGLLHCEGNAVDPRPGVVWEPLDEVLTRYLHPTVWRRPHA